MFLSLQFLLYKLDGTVTQADYCSFYAAVFCLIWTFVVSDLSQVLKPNNFPPECAPGLLFELKCLCKMRQTLCF